MPARRDPQTAATLDLSGLTGPVSLREVNEFYRRTGVPVARRWWAVALTIAALLAAEAIFLRVMMPAFRLDAALSDAVYGGFLVFTGLYALALGAIIWRNAARPARIFRTARANRLAYSDRGAVGLRLPGSVMASPDAFVVTADVLSGGPPDNDLPRFTAATLAPQVAGTRRRHGIAAIALDRQTPHIVLENRRARVLRTTGRRFRGEQRLSLEGDFDRTFTLFCPRGYETDALYIFTPDLMALMIDLASDCEAELLDGWLVLYSGRPWRLSTPRGFTRLISLVDLIGRKMRSRTELYRDEHADAGTAIAIPGRRLRARPSWGAVASTIVPASFIALGLVSMILDPF